MVAADKSHAAHLKEADSKVNEMAEQANIAQREVAELTHTVGVLQQEVADVQGDEKLQNLQGVFRNMSFRLSRQNQAVKSAALSEAQDEIRLLKKAAKKERKAHDLAVASHAEKVNMLEAEIEHLHEMDQVMSSYAEKAQKAVDRYNAEARQREALQKHEEELERSLEAWKRRAEEAEAAAEKGGGNEEVVKSLQEDLEAMSKLAAKALNAASEKQPKQDGSDNPTAVDLSSVKLQSLVEQMTSGALALAGQVQAELQVAHEQATHAEEARSLAVQEAASAAKKRKVEKKDQRDEARTLDVLRSRVVNLAGLQKENEVLREQLGGQPDDNEKPPKKETSYNRERAMSKEVKGAAAEEFATIEKEIAAEVARDALEPLPEGLSPSGAEVLAKARRLREAVAESMAKEKEHAKEASKMRAMALAGASEIRGLVSKIDSAS